MLRTEATSDAPLVHYCHGPLVPTGGNLAVHHGTVRAQSDTNTFKAKMKCLATDHSQHWHPQHIMLKVVCRTYDEE